MKRIALSSCVALVASAVALPAAAQVIKIELPHETASFRTAPGSELANAQCLVCHSVDYVVMQPPLARTVWAAEVKKMREKYGAAVPDELVDTIVTYLAATYGTDTNATLAAATNNVAVATTGEAVVAKYGCLTCHNVNTRINGPAYKEVAAKYQNDPKAEARIAEQIHNGGTGKWGSNLMPPFPIVTDAETKVVAAWILNLK
jgi:cytochrome c551/c552